MREFFNTSSKPVGHGFSEANITNNFACYSFEPKTNMPLKVIVLDDTMSDQDFEFGQQAALDTNRFNWLTNELQLGQDQDQLMIIATHEPLEVICTNSPVSRTNVLAALHTYPNLLLWICGHTHQNNIYRNRHRTRIIRNTASGKSKPPPCGFPPGVPYLGDSPQHRQFHFHPGDGH